MQNVSLSCDIYCVAEQAYQALLLDRLSFIAVVPLIAREDLRWTQTLLNLRYKKHHNKTSKHCILPNIVLLKGRFLIFRFII